MDEEDEYSINELVDMVVDALDFKGKGIKDEVIYIEAICDI